MFIEMIDAHMQAQNKRRLSIVGPCYTHEQWLAVQAERRAANGERRLPARPQRRERATAGPDAAMFIDQLATARRR